MPATSCRFACGVLANVILASGALAAQSPVVSGLHIEIARPRGSDTIVYQRTITRAGVDSGSGTRTVVVQAVAPAGGPELLQVAQRFPGGGGEITDTAVAELSTLAAVAHSSHQPTRLMAFRFEGGHAKGSVTLLRPAGDSTVAVDLDVGGPIFDSNIIELVVAALPLSEGALFRVPFFLYERGGRVEMSVAVRERSRSTFGRLGVREAWVVSVPISGAPATVWVDVRTRAVLRVRYDIAARNMSFTDQRVTDLPS